VGIHGAFGFPRRQPTTLQIAMLRAPFFFASRSAASVSAVSPDWVITIASVFFETIGSR
jgi:hypothetical protein